MHLFLYHYYIWDKTCTKETSKCAKNKASGPLNVKIFDLSVGPKELNRKKKKEYKGEYYRRTSR